MVVLPPPLVCMTYLESAGLLPSTLSPAGESREMIMSVVHKGSRE